MKQVTVSLDDETAQALKESIDRRRDRVELQRLRFANGASTTSQVEELSEGHDTDLPDAVRASIQYTLDDLE